MGTRRLTSLVGQTTLAEIPAVDTPGPPEVDPAPTPPPAPGPRVYAPPESSSVRLRDRQLAWFKERDRRAAPPPPVASDPPA
jgi:hypothetical protein